MITLEIPTAPPSLNRWQRMHWAQRKRTARGMVDALGFALSSAGMACVANGAGDAWLRARRPAKGPREVRIVRRGLRALDHDNLVGGCKPLVDALAKVGLIEDDTPALVTVTYEQERGSGCRVEVWAAQGEREVA